jgi:hypothetical protein
VRPFYPENFLVVCPSQGVRDRMLAAGGVPLAGTTLVLRPWTRLAHAGSEILFKSLSIELDGIPPHVWSMDTASKLLSKYCWIERLHPDTESKTDQSTFKLTAWAMEPCNIPKTTTLLAAEPEPTVVHSDPVLHRVFNNLRPFLRKKKLLSNPVVVHVRAITDFASRSTSPSGPSSPSTNGDSGLD